jgi:HTH-type transcriptional regulator/antitoxin HigA
MLAQDVRQVEQLWPLVAKVLFVPHNDEQYQQLVRVLDVLIDVVGEDETHPLASLMEIVGVLIEQFEDKFVPEVTDI